MAYSSETEALRQLLLLQSYGGNITKSPDGILTIPNGLPYYFVEVTCSDGGTYVIEACGEGAIDLARETAATGTIRKREEALTVKA